MKYTCSLLAVKDIKAAVSFYQSLFGLELYQDYGLNVTFTCGLSLQENFPWLAGIDPGDVAVKANNMEVCFETQDFDGFLEKLSQYPNIEYLGKAVEHSWGQRVVRFYDPDKHLIEVGESLKMVVKRFISQGLTREEIAKKMDVALSDLDIILAN